MHDHMITFQLATHFLSRIALRLEYLFKTINEACNESHEVIHRFALKNIIEIAEIVEKPELKSRFIKELIRIEHVLK
ncbi:cell division protein ZapD, partial [Legionella pneumophila]